MVRDENCTDVLVAATGANGAKHTSSQTCNCHHTRVIIEVEECTIVQMQNNYQSSYIIQSKPIY